MAANLDLSEATVDELEAELDGLLKALGAIESGAGPGHPFDGRDEGLRVQLQQKIAAVRSELAKYNAPRP
jgi:hypothetical protein